MTVVNNLKRYNCWYLRGRCEIIQFGVLYLYKIGMIRKNMKTYIKFAG